MNLQRNPYIIFGFGIALIFLTAIIVYLIYSKSSNPPPSGQENLIIDKPNPVQKNNSQPRKQNSLPPRPPGNPPRPHGSNIQGIMKSPQKDIETVVGGGGASIVLFHSDHCGHCVDMLPAWEETKNVLSEGNQFDVISFENGQQPEEIQNNNIKGFPTVRFYPEGFPSSNFIEYRGNRSAQSFIKFAQSGGQEK
jgi:thiol-disulfide isomerase/thioredoxin